MMLTERFWSKVSQDGDCWIWTAGRSEQGYGRFMLDGKARRAHRLTFAALRAEIPAGLVLDHLCRNRACVNPWHLEPVTDAVNIRRGRAGEAVMNHDLCRNGLHPWPESAEARGDGFMGCGPCRAARNKASLSERVPCECGATLRRGDLARHRGTAKHRRAVA